MNPLRIADDVAIRPLADPGESDECSRIGTRAFGCDTRGWYRPGSALVAVAPRGRIVACLAYGPGHAWWGPDRVPQAFIGGVATDPREQRRGYGAALMAGAVHHLRELGITTCPLWPFSHRWYGRLGWALCSLDPVYEIDSSALRRIPDPGLQTDRVPKRRWERLLPLYRRFAQRYNGMSDRDPRAFRESVGGRRIAAAFDRRGRPAGYAVFADIEEATGLRVDEFAAFTPAAEQALLRWLGRRRRRFVRLVLPADTRLVDRLPEAHEARIHLHTRLSLRVLDPEKALLHVSAPAWIRMTVAFSVRDPVVRKGRAIRFALRIEDGKVQPEPRPSRTAPRVSCDIGAFSQLFSGFRSARDLAEDGRLRVSRPDAVVVLGHWVRRRVPFRSGLERG